METPFKNSTFVFTGEMEMPRDKAGQIIVLLGGRVTTALSGKTTHLVAGNEPGQSKMAKAKDLKIKILNESEFMNILNMYEFKDVINTQIGTASEEISGVNRGFDKGVDKRVKLVEKYKPNKKEELLENKAAIKQLDDFINGKTKYMAALVSGPPGVGKTTAANVISKQYGYEVIEFNASCVRNKSSLREQIGRYMGLKCVRGNKRVIIMDEVDGMTSDRGGISELINIIKNTKEPIICICNDSRHIKMKSLANNCMDIRFSRLNAVTVFNRVKSIVIREGMSIPDNHIREIIIKCSNDLRYVLNTISTWRLRIKDVYEKNVRLDIYELAREIFKNKKVNEKIDIYFEDYDMIPLFVHENYIKTRMKPGSNCIKELFEAADSISYGDVVDASIHGSRQEWSLMPCHALYSCVFPTQGMSLYTRVEFPSYLGNISKSNKNKRILTNIAMHSGNGRNETVFYAGRLLDRYFYNELENENIGGALEILKRFNLNKEDMIELNVIYNNDFKVISTKLKTQLTKEAKKIGKNTKTIEDINEKEEEEE